MEPKNTPDQKITSTSTRKGAVARLTRNTGDLEKVRDELRRAADLVQAVIDGKIYQTDMCPELGITRRSLQYQTLHQFKPYIKSKMETVDGLCERLEAIRTPGDMLLFQVFDITGSRGQAGGGNGILFLPEYDEDALWDAAHGHLTSREFQLLQMACGTDGSGRASYTDIAKEMHVTEGRVHQIHQRAIRKLRSPAFVTAVFPAITAGFASCMAAVMESTGPAIDALIAARTQYENQETLRLATECYRDGRMPDAQAAVRVDQILSGRAEHRKPGGIPVEETGMSHRLLYALRRAGIRTLDELADMPPGKIRGIHNIGHTAIREIRALLQEHFNVDRTDLDGQLEERG